MKRISCAIILLLCLPFVAVRAQQSVESGVKKEGWINHPVTAYFHYLSNFKLAPTALDSFLYRDTISVNGTKYGASWYSRPQIMRITPAGTDGTYYDTLVFAGGTKAGVSWTRAATNTVALTCDSLVALLNAAAVATDSVEAIDSTTYVVVKSKRAAKPTNARFSMILSANLDSAGVGHLSSATLVTAARVCDSIKAKFDAISAFSVYASVDDSSTYVKVYNDSLDKPLTHVARSDSLVFTNNTTTQANVDTTYYYIGDDLESYRYFWFGYTADVDVSSLTNETLLVQPQRDLTDQWSIAKAIGGTDTLVSDASTWTLQRTLAATTANDTIFKYPYFRIRIIQKTQIADTGSSRSAKKDSIYYNGLHWLIRGIK